MQCDQVLIVEDEADARESLKLLLELEGYEVAVAGNDREALEVLHRNGRRSGADHVPLNNGSTRSI